MEGEEKVRKFTNAWGDLGIGEVRERYFCLLFRNYPWSAWMLWRWNFREG